MDINDIIAKEEFKSLDEFLNSEMDKFAGKELIKLIVDVWGDEEVARNWFYSNAIGLGGKRPYDYCKDGKIEEVKNLLGRIEYGSCL